jgi:hypothetical protein
MTILTLPVAPKIATVEWTLTQPTQANRSEFTGARRVVILAVAPRWSAKVKFVRAVGEVHIKPLRAFLAALQGQAGRFYLRMGETAQISAAGGAVVVDGAGQGAYTLATRGWNGGTMLGAGDFVTVGGQPLQLVAPAVPDADGRAMLYFAPYLRSSPADGDAVEVVNPCAIMSLTGDAAGWSVSPGQVYDVSIDCEEAA